MQLKKPVTNEDFNKAYTNKDNRNIIYSVLSRYAKVIDKEVLESCAQMGLWRCLGQHDDSYGQKFTTSLWRFVDWECKKELRKVKREKEVGATTMAAPIMDMLDSKILEKNSIESSEIMHVNECLDLLPKKDKEILYMYFFENRTMEEIGKIHGCSKQNTGQKIAKALARFKNVYNGKEDVLCQTH